MSPGASQGRQLALRAVVTEGLSLATSRNGVVLLCVYLLVKFVTDLLIFAGGGTYLPLDQTGGRIGADPGLPVGTELPLPVTAGALALALGFTIVLNMPLTIVAIRTFVSGATDRIPDDALFHRLGRATLSGLLAAAAFGVTIAVLLAVGGAVIFSFVAGNGGSGPLSVGLGVAVLVALVAAFISLWVQFVFVPHGIAVQDRGVIGAARESWVTVRGHRLRLLVLIIGLGMLSVVTGEIATLTLTESIDPLLLVALFVEAALSGVVSVVGTAVFAVAYRDLVTGGGVRSG